jgi:hypothetical protein
MKTEESVQPPLRQEAEQDDEEGIAAEPLLPTYSEDGVDLTLIRWMLSLTPLERLRVMQQYAASTYRMQNAGKKLRL